MDDIDINKIRQEIHAQFDESEGFCLYCGIFLACIIILTIAIGYAFF